MLAKCKIMCNFAVQTAPQKPGHGQCGWVGRHFFEKRLSTLILDSLKSLQDIKVKD